MASLSLGPLPLELLSDSPFGIWTTHESAQLCGDILTVTPWLASRSTVSGESSGDVERGLQRSEIFDECDYTGFTYFSLAASLTGSSKMRLGPTIGNEDALEVL